MSYIFWELNPIIYEKIINKKIKQHKNNETSYLLCYALTKIISEIFFLKNI